MKTSSSRSGLRITNHESRVASFALRDPRRAFTLLEVLVATGVLALMVTILFELFSEGSNAWQLGERRADVNQGVRTVLGMIARDASLAVMNICTNKVSPLTGLAVTIHRSALGENAVSSPTSLGVCEELCFVAPVEAGNETTNDTYRALCGVRYYVTKQTPAAGQQNPVLGNLVRVLYKTQSGTKSQSLFSLYANDWTGGGVPLNCYTNAAIIAENVLTFRVQPARYDAQYALSPLNASMFRDMNDADLTINGSTFVPVNGELSPTYPGLYIGLCVVDSRTASRINKMGLEAASKITGFQTTTNWVVVHFENYKRGGT